MTVQMQKSLPPASPRRAQKNTFTCRLSPAAAGIAAALAILFVAVLLVHSLAPQICFAMGLTAVGCVILKIIAYLFALILAFSAGTELYWRMPDQT